MPDLEPPTVPEAEPPTGPEASIPPRRSDRARRVFVAPWSRRRARRVGAVAVVLCVLGPILGSIVALLLIPSEPGDVLSVDQNAAAVLDVRGTIQAINPVRGEASVQLVLTRSEVFDDDAPTAEVVGDDGVLDEDLTLIVNDANGQSTRVLAAGTPPGTVTTTLALTGSRVNRYPLDRYRSALVVAVRTEDDDVVPARLSLRSSDPEFSIEATDASSTEGVSVVDLQVARRNAVIGWVAFFVLVCWMLAVAGGSIGWVTVVHGIPSPAWGWGFLIGILFALPSLRAALPGSPPSGSLVDLAAFYWAVGIVAFTLVAMIASWNIRVRRAPNEPDSPVPRT